MLLVAKSIKHLIKYLLKIIKNVSRGSADYNKTSLWRLYYSQQPSLLGISSRTNTSVDKLGAAILLCTCTYHGFLFRYSAVIRTLITDLLFNSKDYSKRSLRKKFLSSTSSMESSALYWLVKIAPYCCSGVTIVSWTVQLIGSLDLSNLTGSLKTTTISVSAGLTPVAQFEGIVSATLRLAKAVEQRDIKLKQITKTNIINRLIFLYSSFLLFFLLHHFLHHLFHIESLYLYLIRVK